MEKECSESTFIRDKSFPLKISLILNPSKLHKLIKVNILIQARNQVSMQEEKRNGNVNEMNQKT